jgi:hypothetical protein
MRLLRLVSLAGRWRILVTAEEKRCSLFQQNDCDLSSLGLIFDTDARRIVYIERFPKPRITHIRIFNICSQSNA